MAVVLALWVIGQQVEVRSHSCINFCWPEGSSMLHFLAKQKKKLAVSNSYIGELRHFPSFHFNSPGFWVAAGFFRHSQDSFNIYPFTFVCPFRLKLKQSTHICSFQAFSSHILLPVLYFIRSEHPPSLVLLLLN